jgi:hypothetical protein
MEIKGKEVVRYLNGPNSVRDGSLVNLTVQNVNIEPVVELTFEIPGEAEVRVVELELRDILEFDYSYLKENPLDVIQFVKCLWTDMGDFYLSLDPYSEHEPFISDKDNEVFRSRFVKLIE